jgi:phenylacetate-CoA ligase
MALNIEFEPRDVIKKFQEQKLKVALEYLLARSPFYQSLFKTHHIDIRKIRTLEDLSLIPFTTKEELQQNNDDFYCVNKSKIVDYITTSGSMSEPTTFAMTDRDLDRLAYNEALSFSCADGTSNDVYQLMTTIDKRFMAGLAYFLGIRKMGAAVIRVGNGIPELQFDTINRIKPNAIICVPSFILKLIDYAKEQGIDYNQLSVKKAVCIGENLRNDDFSLNALGQKIKQQWDIDLYSTYASTEMGTTFCECKAGRGGHHHPELIICELLDDNNNIVKEGEYGELTITTLGVEGMPLLRFKTGDICRFHYEKCECGRTSMRISPIKGRKNQMIKFKGTTLYPAAIFDVLDNISYIDNYIVEVSSTDIETDNVVIFIGLKEDKAGIELEKEKELKDRFRAHLRVAPQIRFENPQLIRQMQFPSTARKQVKLIYKGK